MNLDVKKYNEKNVGFRRMLVTTFLVLMVTISLGQKPGKGSININHKDGIAIQGYDPVAYFAVNKATKGKKELAASFEGVIYYFSSASNKDTFIKNPRKYEPQYGGWCAYAMGATGEKVEIDPETFKILDGKLYLFYHTWSNNTLPKWNKDEVKLKANADKFWQKIAG